MYNVLAVRQISESLNELTPSPYRSHKIKFHILWVRRKCGWIN